MAAQEPEVTTYPQKIAFSEMRASGVRDALIYCRDHRAVITSKPTLTAGPTIVRFSDIEPNFTCTRCGKKGAEVRPSFPQARMGTG